MNVAIDIGNTRAKLAVFKNNQIEELFIGTFDEIFNSLKKISVDFQLNKSWKYLGILGAFAGVLILSYYSVFAGIAFSYIFNIFPSGLENPSKYSTSYFSCAIS